jgi:hypothetical protein
LMAQEVAFCNPDARAESTPRGPGGSYGPRNLGFSLRSGREYRTGNRCMDLRDGNGIKGYGSRTSISRNSAAPVAEHTYLAGAVVTSATSDSLISKWPWYVDCAKARTCVPMSISSTMRSIPTPMTPSGRTPTTTSMKISLAIMPTEASPPTPPSADRRLAGVAEQSTFAAPRWRGSQIVDRGDCPSSRTG